MILFLLEQLDEKTKELIQNEQRERNCWVINDGEYENRYELIMTHWRLETELILSGRIHNH